ncbi:MAG: hypothetical protein BMS9Abin29_1385 [Gemmatimonadota bacterium]|nr:MAG: hypothetical protein BMS9Abin29_1385 [Gemmatimonadota bacterium]
MERMKVRSPWACLSALLVIAASACASAGGGPAVQALSQRYTVRIERGLTSADISDSVFAMNALMAEWDPVGSPMRDVLTIVGTPTESTPDTLLYRFDSGFGGWEWIFALASDRVTGVEKRSLE